MKTALFQAPAKLPVTREEAKRNARITASDHDELIDDLIKSSTAWVEQYLCRKLITQTWKMYLDSWPSGSMIVAFGDLQSITHVKYTDQDSVQTTFDAANYTVDTASVPGKIILNPQQTWPTGTLHPANPIEVQFVTGYGASADSVPPDIKRGILLMINHGYLNPEVFVAQRMEPKMIPLGAHAHLSHHRVWRWCA